MKGWIKFFFKAAIFIAVFVTVILMVLASLGGDSDVLKGAIEEYAGEFSGHPAKVEKLVAMKFYPDFSVELEGLSLHDPANKEIDLLRAGKVRAAMGFWDLAFVTGRFKTFVIEDLRAEPGMLVSPAVTVRRAAIVTHDDAEPEFRADGGAGPHGWSLVLGLETVGEGRSAAYQFGARRPFSLKLADLEASGTLENLRPRNLHMKDLSLKGPDGAMTGVLDLDFGEEDIRIAGDLQTAAGKNLKPDLTLDYGGGVWSAQHCAAEDLAGIGPVLQSVAETFEVAYSTSRHCEEQRDEAIQSPER